MRPGTSTPAHTTGYLGELVCSNSLKSESTNSPTGRLKEDLALLDSLIIAMARRHRVPAGKALAVDRKEMGQAVTAMIGNQPSINLIREEITEIPKGYDRVIVATGPLTSESLSKNLATIVGSESLYFYDAIAPIVDTDSIDRDIAFIQNRYGAPGDGDYLNLPMTRDQYVEFVQALLDADTVALKDFEKRYYFEGCLPIEEIASRGPESLCFGPLKPVGLTGPDNRRSYAVVQLRKENVQGDSYSLVGFQTRLKITEQQRVFRTIPGMSRAEFLKYGSLHRNTYVNSPSAVNHDLAIRTRPDVRLAGQITGVEGYVESVAIGLLAALFTVADLTGTHLKAPPPTTTLGALLNYITDPGRGKNFQPTNINFSLFPPAKQKIKNRKLRRSAAMDLAKDDFMKWKSGLPDDLVCPAANIS